MLLKVTRSVRLSAAASAAAAAALAFGALASPAHAQSQLSGLAGNWSGGGQIRLDDGRSERVSCRAFYNPRDGGLGLALRCASQSYKIELRSSLRVNGSRVSGTWEERSFNASGAISGSASSGSLNMSFSGSLNGSMSVNYGASSQRVSITTGGPGLTSVSLSLSRS